MVSKEDEFMQKVLEEVLRRVRERSSNMVYYTETTYKLKLIETTEDFNNEVNRFKK